eukprot:COSAG02_NODE_1239_length_13713_cov_37.434259_1_plen_72_part_00
MLKIMLFYAYYYAQIMLFYAYHYAFMLKLCFYAFMLGVCHYAFFYASIIGTSQTENKPSTGWPARLPEAKI